MRKTRWAPIAALMLASGCGNVMGLDGDRGGRWGTSGVGTGGCFVCGIAVASSDHLIKGDTVKVWIWESLTPDRWEISDSSLRFVDSDSTGRLIATPRDSALIIAVRKGTGTVRASFASRASYFRPLTVHDSSDVDRLTINWPRTGVGLRAGTSLSPNASLLAGGLSVQGKITWHTSDTTVAFISTRPGSVFDGSITVMSRKVGFTYVIATFGSVRDSVGLNIIP